MKQRVLLKNSIRLDRLFQEYKDKPALLTSRDTLHFNNIEERLRSVAANLADAGIGRGHKVAIHEANSALHLYLFLASWLMDFLYLPLDFKAPVDACLSDTAVDFLITDAPATPDAHVAVLRTNQLMRPSRETRQNVIWPAIPFHQEAAAVHTSGSTGRPRGIVHTVGNYVYSALGTNAFIGLDASDRWLLSLPLFHVGGVLIWLRTLLVGCACILPDSLQSIASAVRQHHPTVISVVPTQLMRLIEQADLLDILKSMKTIMLGGAPSPSWLINKALDLGLPIMPTYGCTESCAQVTGVAKGSSRNAYQTAGRAVPYRNIRIDQDGVILLAGHTIFKRYLHEQKPCRRDRDGFFRTADAGVMDADGHLTISGRTDGVFLSGGENISPVEIENQLRGLDGVISAVVIPVPHREFGMTPWAFVETTEPFDEKTMMDSLRKSLPGYKVPKRIIPLHPDDKQGKIKISRENLIALAQRMVDGEEPS